jgi:hypothetical protein
MVNIFGDRAPEFFLVDGWKSNRSLQGWDEHSSLSKKRGGEKIGYREKTAKEKNSTSSQGFFSFGYFG